MRKNTSLYEWVRQNIWVLLLIWIMVLHFLYLLGREGGFSDAAKAGLGMLPIYLALLAAVCFSSPRQNRKKR